MYRIFLRITVLLIMSAKAYCQCGSVNMTQTYPNAIAFASQSTNDAIKAFDVGSSYQTTYWSSGGAGGYQLIAIDFGQAFNPCELKFQWGANEYPIWFSVKGSNDYQNWTTLYSDNNNHSSTFTISDAAVTGSYSIYQIDLFTASGTTGYTLFNCEFHKYLANVPPTVSITAPTSTGTYYVNQPIPLTVEALDINGGSVSKVDYYLDNNTTTPLATSNSSPFGSSWSTPTLGIHTITAKATDNQNLASTAATVTINVLAAPAYMKNWTLTGNNLINSNTGTVFIGPPPATPANISDAKLLVYGNMYAQKLTVKASWADYVFKKGYYLRPLSEVETYISKHKHLPDVPSAKQIEEKGVSVGENQAILLKKIEELTLYLIEQNKKISKLQQQLVDQNKKIGSLSANK